MSLVPLSQLAGRPGRVVRLYYLGLYSGVSNQVSNDVVNQHIDGVDVEARIDVISEIVIHIADNVVSIPIATVGAGVVILSDDAVDEEIVGVEVGHGVLCFGPLIIGPQGALRGKRL